MSSSLSRRRFLQTTGAISASGLVGSTLFGHMSAMAQVASNANFTDYKALVCIFLYGGNDGFNTVLPLDATSWAEYTRRRTSPSGLEKMTLVLANPLRITSGTTEYGLHPSLSKVKALYAASNSKLAVLANVGPLVGNTVNNVVQAPTKANYKRPPGLYSHNDQQTLWQSGKDNVDAGGWGGRMMESLQISGKVANSPFLSLNTGSNTNFVYGNKLAPYGLATSPTGAVKLGKIADIELIFGAVPRSKLVDLARGAAGAVPTHLLEKDYAALVQRSVDAEAELGDPSKLNIGGVDLGVPLPTADGKMLRELEIIGKMIKANAGKPGRQVFFVRHDGYDTHGGQKDAHEKLLGELDTAIDYFYRTLNNNKLLDKVTTFTASDFGRQLSNNGEGTDHGWGGHHFIMGGAVKGGKIYGRVPTYDTAVVSTTPNVIRDFTDPNMIEASGIMLPEVSTDQYAATLATWFGITSQEAIKSILPNHFGTTNLGFLA
jgi:uncharacterized protein (DUF1501 family)